MGVLKLDISCSATNKYLTMLPFYHKATDIERVDPYRQLLTMRNNTKISLWEPVVRMFPSFEKTELPRELSGMKEFPIQGLIETLHQIERNKICHKQMPGWIKVLLCSLMVSCIVI